eukprot:jgi/Ulvmu1/9525/UM053_0013.1
MLGSIFLMPAVLGTMALASEVQLETPRLTQSAQRGEFGVEGDSSAFRFSFSDPEVSAVTDNEAVLQQRVTKASNPFLSTLTALGESQFLTALKPCGILMPHMHMRANEFYTVLSGVMDAGISQENGVAQDITFEVGPGEVFLVPQGLMHYNFNARCEPNFFTQTFTSSDGGAINVVGALAALRDGSASGAEAIAASGAGLVSSSPQGSFALSAECLKRCGLPPSGAPGDGLEGLPNSMRAVLGLAPVADDDDSDGGYGGGGGGKGKGKGKGKKQGKGKAEEIVEEWDSGEEED